MKTYIALIETDQITRIFVKYEAYSSSEAQAYALDDIKNNQLLISIWEQVL
jgi:hypothetical protein